MRPIRIALTKGRLEKMSVQLFTKMEMCIRDRDAVSPYTFAWNYHFAITGPERSFAYSCLTQLPDDRIGILERMTDEKQALALEKSWAYEIIDYTFWILLEGSVPVSYTHLEPGCMNGENRLPPPEWRWASSVRAFAWGACSGSACLP